MSRAEVAPVMEASRPRSEQVTQEILARAEPLRSDEAVRSEFYGRMGVVRTELQLGKNLHGNAVYIVDQRKQPSGAYKSRGASYAAMHTDPKETIVTYSTGNHGISMGIAGRRRNQNVRVEATKSISRVKYERLSGTGADIYNVHADFAAAERQAMALGNKPGYTVIGPFGHPDVIAGQCSLGFEIVEGIIKQGLVDQQVIIPVAVAGGGHLSGIAIPIWEAKQKRLLGEGIKVVAVQPEGTDTLYRAIQKMRAGEDPVDLYPSGTGPDSLCDALVIAEESLNHDTMAIAADPAFVQGFYRVGKPAIGRAMAAAEAECGGAVEPAAALPRAFAEQYDGRGVTFILPISGGNVSEETKRTYEQIVQRDDFERLSADHLDMSRRGDPLDEIARRGERPRSSGHLALGSAAMRASRQIAFSGSRQAYHEQLQEQGLHLLSR